MPTCEVGVAGEPAGRFAFLFFSFWYATFFKTYARLPLPLPDPCCRTVVQRLPAGSTVHTPPTRDADADPSALVCLSCLVSSLLI